MVSRAVYRNGSLLAEPYAVHKFSATAFSRDNFPLNISDAPYSDNQRTIAAMSEMISKHVASGDLIVPPGKYFVLGDNRDNSLDSRYWGLLDESEIIGKPVLIYYSPGHWDRLMKLL
jgi:signal peptidase I